MTTDAHNALIHPADHFPAIPGHRAWHPRRWWGRLNFDDRAALGMWAAAHLALLVLAWAASWAYRSPKAEAPFTGRFEQWDASIFRGIAAHGYFSAQSTAHSVVFFPGFPVVLAAVHLVLRNWTLSELAVSAVAGCFAVVSLSRLAGNRRAVLYLLGMPAAVFLLVGYSECLFLAFAVPAWNAGARGLWRRAAVLAALAGLVRPDGVFLTAGLAVMALTGEPGRRLRGAAVACLGLAGPLAYETYLRAATGSWSAWRQADQAGWGLHVVTPLSAWKVTWGAAFGHEVGAAYAFEFQTEIIAVAVTAAAVAAFLAARRWPEAVYCGLALAALATQTWYQSGERTLLVLFPVYVALARFDVRRPWARWAVLSISVPLAVVMGFLYLSGQFAG